MKIIIAGLLLLVSSAAGLSSWKMLEFHDRLRAFENSEWERKLDSSGVYRRGGVIVMFGDSQISEWPMATSFGVMPVVNRGLPGDWAEKAAERFNREALTMHPNKVVLLIGTNDIGHNRRPADVAGRVLRLAGAAKSSGAQVVICSVLPVRGEFVANHPAAQLVQLNSLLASGAASMGAKWIDLHSALVDSNGLMREELTVDGLHPNASGYLAMTSVLLPEIN